jgi:hypothetical protein
MQKLICECENDKFIVMVEKGHFLMICIKCLKEHHFI